MADEQAAIQGEWLWGDDPLDDPRPPGTAFDEPLLWPDAIDWPPPPPPLGDTELPPLGPDGVQANGSAQGATGAPLLPPPPPLEALEPLDFDAGPAPDAAAGANEPVPDLTAKAAAAAAAPVPDPAAPPPDPDVVLPEPQPAVAGPPPALDVIPASIWGPASEVRAAPVDPAPAAMFADPPARPLEDTQLSMEPIPDSFWDQGPGEDPPAVAPAARVAPRPKVYAEPERPRAGGAAAWFQVRHPTAAMAGLAVFVVLVVVGLVLSVRNKPDASVTDAAQRSGTISAQRLPSTTVIPTTTTATTKPVAIADLQPPSTDPGATPGDAGGAPANGAAPATGRTTTPTTRAAAPASNGGGGGGNGGGGGTAPASTTGTTAAPAAPDTTQPPATSPPDTTPVTTPPSTRRTTTSVTPPTTPPVPTTPTTPTSLDFPSIPRITR